MLKEDRPSLPPGDESLRAMTAQYTAVNDRHEAALSGKKREVIYVCHPLNAPTREGIDANRKEAAKWAAFLATYFHVAPECSWIVLTGEFDETPENRKRGLEIDLALVERCDEVVMVGPRVSDGMLLESEHARKLGKPVANLTRLSREPKTIALAWLPSRELKP